MCYKQKLNYCKYYKLQKKKLIQFTLHFKVVKYRIITLQEIGKCNFFQIHESMICYFLVKYVFV